MILLLFNYEEGSVAFLDHNLTEEEVARDVKELREQGFPAVTISQMAEHSRSASAECDECLAAIEAIAEENNAKVKKGFVKGSASEREAA